MLTTAVVKRSSFDPDMSFTSEGLEDLCHAFSLFFFRAYHDLARPIWRISWQLEHPECKAEKVFQGPESATENFLWLESCHEKISMAESHFLYHKMKKSHFFIEKFS